MRAILLMAFAFTFLNVSAQCDEIDPLNEEIISLARAKKGKKVLRGECWDLAKYVLEETGAKWDGMYEYGRLLKPGECLMPGDIIQFKNVKIQYKIGRSTYTELMTHHTAIINEVVSENEVELIHQNTAIHGKKVTTSLLRFNTVVKGKYMIYRPVPGSSD